MLALVESGKITAEDGAELLSALGHSYAAGTARSDEGRISGNQRAMLLGAGLLLVGFFLPWLHVKLDQQMRGIMENLLPQMAQAVGQPPSNQPRIVYNSDGSARVVMPEQNPQFNMSVPVYSAKTVWQLRGGDLSNGLGWFIMLLGVGVAVLPLVWPTRPGQKKSPGPARRVTGGPGHRVHPGAVRVSPPM